MIIYTPDNQQVKVDMGKLLEEIGTDFMGQITTYRIEENGTRFTEYIFYIETIFVRNFFVCEHTEDDNMILESYVRTDSMVEVMLEHISILVNEELYFYEIDF